MELRHLRYFRAVADSGGFREAARRLHIVQPALSQTVSDLERELGVTLLVRNSRAVRLTAEGEIFLQEVKQILEHAEVCRVRHRYGERAALALERNDDVLLRQIRRNAVLFGFRLTNDRSVSDAKTGALFAGNRR